MASDAQSANCDPAVLLSQALAKEALHEVRFGSTPSRRYRASEAGDCARKIYYRVSGFRPWPEDPMAGLSRISGNALHDITRQLMLAHGVDVAGVEVLDDYTVEETESLRRVYDGVELSSRADGIIRDALLEIKTVSYWAFKKLEEAYAAGGNAGVLDYVRAKYTGFYAQTNVTCGMLELKNIILLPVGRDKLQIGLRGVDNARHSILFPFDQAEFDKHVARFQRIDKAVADQTPPRAEFANGSYECDFCKWHYMCHGAKHNPVHPLDREE